MSEIPRSAGISCERLYRALKETGNPELSTVARVLKALDPRLSVLPNADEKTKRRAKATKKAA